MDNFIIKWKATDRFKKPKNP